MKNIFPPYVWLSILYLSVELIYSDILKLKTLCLGMLNFVNHGHLVTAQIFQHSSATALEASCSENARSNFKTKNQLFRK